MMRVKTFSSNAVEPLLQDFFKRATEAAEQGYRMVPLNAPSHEIEEVMLIKLAELGYKKERMFDKSKNLYVVCAAWL